MKVLNIYHSITRLTLFLLFISSALFSDSQIQRNFSDFELGVTTKDGFTKVLDERGIKYSDSLLNITIFDDINFYNVNWNGLGLAFFNNKLYNVGLVKMDEPAAIQSFYNELLECLKGIYNDYYIPQENSSQLSYFRDKDTIIILEYAKDMNCVSLDFRDRNFLKELGM